MQGLNYLDLAKVLANEHYENTNAHSVAPKNRRGRHNARQWAGTHLIHLGERLVPRTTELQLKVSTGPPRP
jgi:hypothetical protein